MHRCDRAVIYIFIAASYFPWVTLRASPEGTIASHLSWIVWVLAFCGISYQQIFHERYKKLETFFYIFMGVAPALTVFHNWVSNNSYFLLRIRITVLIIIIMIIKILLVFRKY